MTKVAINGFGRIGRLVARATRRPMRPKPLIATLVMTFLFVS
jgi:glyceraldehyde-3-phosphate dehydrogenase/erythrose-4-phosphate dehydrogenase